jgi:hypothetical protein
MDPTQLSQTQAGGQAGTHRFPQGENEERQMRWKGKSTDGD